MTSSTERRRWSLASRYASACGMMLTSLRASRTWSSGPAPLRGGGPEGWCWLRGWCVVAGAGSCGLDGVSGDGFVGDLGLAAQGQAEQGAQGGQAGQAEGGQGGDVGDLGDLPPAVGVQ